MNDDQAIRFRIGIFVLAALLLLGVLVLLFGGFPNYFKPAHTFTIVFDTAKGVAPGTPVRRSGVKVGEVRKVRLDDQTGQVYVEVSIDPTYTVRENDQPTLVPQGILGAEMAIEFIPRPPDGKLLDPLPGGPPPAPPGKNPGEQDLLYDDEAQEEQDPLAEKNPPVKPGSTLKGVTQSDVNRLMEQAGELMPPARDTLLEMQKVFRRIDRMTPLMEDTLREFREVARATRDMIPELRKTNDEVRELARATRLTIPELRRTNDEFQLTARIWGKLGERLDVFLISNEEKLTRAVERLEETLRRVGEVFNEENQKNLSATLKNVRVGSERLDSITRNTDELVKESRITIRRVNDALVRTDDVLANMQKATRPLADRSETILRNLEESTDKMNRILGDLRDVFGSITRREGTLQRLLNDPVLYNNLNELTCGLTRLLPRVDRALRDVEIFADKIARHPEALGVGGVVRPSNGLKEAPTVLPYHGPSH